MFVSADVELLLNVQNCYVYQVLSGSLSIQKCAVGFKSSYGDCSR